MQRNIIRRLMLTFGVMLAVMLIMGAWSLRTMATLNSHVESVASGTSPGVERAGRITMMAADLEAALGRTVISTARADEKGTLAAIARIDSVEADLVSTAKQLESWAQDRETRDRCRQLIGLIGEWQSGIDAVKGFAKNGQAFEAAEGVEKARGLAQQTASVAASIATAQNDVLAATRTTAASSYSRSWWMMVVVLGVATASAVGGWKTVFSVRTTLNRVAQTLTDSTNQVLGAAEHVAASSGSLSEGATRQAASLEQTSASMEEMASMTRRNAESAEQASALMGNSERTVLEANSALGDLVEAMRGIQESSGKVAKIVKAIDEIAFQTNILALNAAVEAARAGESGMGFAVVADEVRSLAQRSAQAAKDTAVLIEDAAGRAAAGGAKVSRVESAMAGATASAAQVKVLIDDISTASRQQAQGIDQVTQTVGEMERVTQTTAATAEESAAASVNLNEQARQARAAVVELESLIGSRVVAATEPAVPAATPAQRATVTSRASSLRLAHRGRERAVSGAEEQLPLESAGGFGRF